MILVALLDEKPVGTISLFSDSLIKDNKYTPWIANMFVVEDKRNMGIGTYMHNYMLEEALTMGFEKLYIATNLDGFFERLGWTYKETTITINGNETNLYVKELE
ncbi:MAG: GNAT family N-acetyltransferase [Bacillota bacterium]